MVYMIIYFFCAYSLALCVITLFRKRGLIKKGVAGLLLLSIVLAVPLLPYGVVELQTALYGKEFLQPIGKAIPEMNMPSFHVSEIRSMKVLRKCPHSAVIYLVYGDRAAGYDGFLIGFVQSGTGWKYTGDFDVVWSDTGSAHGNIFPPYPDKGDW